MTPFISVITPTWNRARQLERVWASLDAQTASGFEWIVGDDGSEDETEALIQELAARSWFPVLYLRAEAHVGKVRMDNEAIRRARGCFSLWCDSDDWLTPDAIEHILSAWGNIPSHRRSEYGGLTALAATRSGVIVDPFDQIGLADVTWNDLAAVHRVKGDMVYVARTTLLQRNPFPEVDLVVPESVVWTRIGDHPTRVIRAVLKMVEYQAGSGVSFSNRMAYNRGRAYSAAGTRRALIRFSSNRLRSARELLNFIRYALHGELSLRAARRLWGGNSASLIFWAAVPFAQLFAIRDVVLGKVVYSHREFEKNRGALVVATRLQGSSLA